jgi:hypothetical protein
MTRKDLVYLAGAACAVVTALAAQVNVLPTAWQPYATVAGLVGATLAAYMARSPHDQ